MSAPLPAYTVKWGDVVGPFDPSSDQWSPSDDSVDVPFDVVAIIDKFSNKPFAPMKSRVDLRPSTPDRIINVVDISLALEAFRGIAYPFAPSLDPCP